LDEAVVKIAEAEERLKFFEFLRLWPFSNAVEFSRVHFNLAVGDCDAQVVDQCLVEGALFGLQIKVIV
jgi:hypothetical protein